MKKNVWSIVLTYAVVASLWIFFSDRLLGVVVEDPQTLLKWSLIKGLFFVTVTAAMLYILIARLMRKIWRMSSFWMASERKFRTLFQEITDGVIVSEVETLKIYMGNHAIVQMLGYSDAELRKLTLKDIHPPEFLPHLTEDFEKHAQGLATHGRSLPVKRKDGTIFYVDINASSFDLEDKRYVIGVFHDITEHRRTENALQEAKESAEAANQAKDQFIAVLSHELRTPLTPVLATVAALRGQPDLPEQTHADLEVVRRNLELESKLIDDLLDVTRISRGKIDLILQRTDLYDSLRGAMEICRPEIEA